ncbi:MAG: DinB family protein [Gemmatimonadaceae bacterium]|nr:DinB family protein [Gemmatimonadaceae bacterium]
MTISSRPPAPDEYAPFYAGYVSAVPDGDVVETLRRSGAELMELLTAVPEERGGHRYAPGKWTIREVVGHVNDTERVMTYRLMRIARGDATPLPGFDQNDYVRLAGADRRTLADLTQELAAVRAGSVALVQSLPDEAWDRRGMASGHPISARALAYITAGHSLHHLALLRQRYLA